MTTVRDLTGNPGRPDDGPVDRSGQPSWAGMVNGYHYRHTGVAWSEPQARPLTRQRNSRNPYGFRPLVLQVGFRNRISCAYDGAQFYLLRYCVFRSPSA